jgi:hypothetical protein
MFSSLFVRVHDTKVGSVGLRTGKKVLLDGLAASQKAISAARGAESSDGKLG